MMILGIIAGWIGWMVAICIIVFAVTGLVTDGKFNNTVALVKILGVILAIFILAFQIYIITFNAHPEDYGYVKIIEETSVGEEN